MLYESSVKLYAIRYRWEEIQFGSCSNAALTIEVHVVGRVEPQM